MPERDVCHGEAWGGTKAVTSAHLAKGLRRSEEPVRRHRAQPRTISRHGDEDSDFPVGVDHLAGRITIPRADLCRVQDLACDRNRSFPVYDRRYLRLDRSA